MLLKTFPKTTYVLISALLGLLAVSGAAPSEAQATAPYQRTIIVSPVPGDHLASGAALRAAVAAATPTATSPWLIKLEPGIYDLGTEPLVLKRRLDIEGSSTQDTTIAGQGQAVLNRFEGVLVGADRMEVRHLKLTCISTKERPACIAMANVGVSPRLTDVKIVVNQGFDGNWGLRNTDASPILDRVEMTIAHAADNYGIVNDDYLGESHPTIRRSVILAKGGSVWNIGILDKNRSGPLLVEDTEITAFGGINAAAMKSFSGSSSPVVLRRVTFLAHSANKVYGVDTGLSQFVVDHSRIEALGTGGVGLGGEFLLNDVTVEHSIVKGNHYSVAGNEVSVQMSTIGVGPIGAAQGQCAAVVGNGGTFHATTCP